MFEKKTCALLFNVAIVTNINAFHFFLCTNIRGLRENCIFVEA